MEILKKSDYFSNLSHHNQEQLSGICLPKSLRKKEILFLEGDRGYALYLCSQGSIQLYKTSEDGHDVVIKIVRPGELFAEVILFEQERYPVSGMALEESQVLIISKAQFTCLLESPEFRNEFISILMGKMRYLAEKLQYITHHDVEERLRRFLREQYGEREEIVSSLSKKSVAASIGTTPETLSRLLLRLKKDGKMEWDKKRIEIRWDLWR